jgi:hypothetical protein
MPLGGAETGAEPPGRGTPIARVWCGDACARGGARAGAADGDALASPSRSSTTRRRSPPVCTPPIRRRPPPRGH